MKIYIDSLTHTIIRKGYSPYIDEETGTWWEWDESTHDYKDTEVSSGAEYAAAAASSASSAASSASDSAMSAQVAGTRAGVAAEAATAAATSATAADASKTAAAASATNAASSATAAAASETAAAASATNAASSATAAAAAKTEAQTAAASASAAYGTDLLAANYSTSSTYAVGDHVIYSGHLYVCNTAITTAEAWTAAHWTQVNVGGELTDLKEDLNDVSTALEWVEPTNKFNPATAVEGYSIRTNGNLIASESNFTSDFIPCNGGDTFYYTSARISDSVHAFYGITAANVSHFAQYDANKQFISGTRQQWVNSVVLDDSCRYVRFSNPLTHLQDEIRIISVTFNDYPTDWQYVTEYFDKYYYLTAERFKEHVADFESFEDDITVVVYPENVLNLNDIAEDTILVNGEFESNADCFSTNYYVPAKYGDVVTLVGIRNTGVYYHKGINIVRIAMYDADKAFLANSDYYVQDYVINQPNCAYIRFTLNDAYNSATYTKVSVSINAIPTPASITEYFEPYRSATKPSQDTIRNRRVLWLGTSIPTYGYPQILARQCGCNMKNEAIGSSGIAKGITPNITTANVCGIRSIWGLYGLTQTVAEKQTMIDNWATIATEIDDTTELTQSIQDIALASSYETIVDPYLTGDDAVDLIILNHGYNDSTEYAVAESGQEYDCHTLEGAYNWLIKHIIEANPHIGIVIFGHYSDLPTSKETALQNVADRWNIPYYLLKNDLGWSGETITTTQQINSNGEWVTIEPTSMTVRQMWLGDNVHPLGVATKRIAQVSQNVFADWLRMYCDEIA